MKVWWRPWSAGCWSPRPSQTASSVKFNILWLASLSTPFGLLGLWTYSGWCYEEERMDKATLELVIIFRQDWDGVGKDNAKLSIYWLTDYWDWLIGRHALREWSIPHETIRSPFISKSALKRFALEERSGWGGCTSYTLPPPKKKKDLVCLFLFLISKEPTFFFHFFFLQAM